jgi:hypothetical protein
VQFLGGADVNPKRQCRFSPALNRHQGKAVGDLSPESRPYPHLHLRSLPWLVSCCCCTAQRIIPCALAHYYGVLLELKPSVVVRVNAALVSAYAHGPAVALAQLDELVGNTSLRDYAPAWRAAKEARA